MDYLLAKRGLGAPQKRPYLSDPDPQGAGDLGVAEAAVAEDQDRRRLGREAPERLADLASGFVLFDQALGIRCLAGSWFSRCGRLASLAPLPSAKAVERGMDSCRVQPRWTERSVGGMAAMEVDEDLLGHVLSLVAVGEHPIGDGYDFCVLGPEEGLEGVFGPPRLSPSRVAHRQRSFDAHHL
jgi:hypothetical protein